MIEPLNEVSPIKDGAGRKEHRRHQNHWYLLSDGITVTVTWKLVTGWPAQRGHESYLGLTMEQEKSCKDVSCFSNLPHVE